MKVSRKDFKRVVVTDESPDLSHIGEYSNTAGDNAIDREERGERGRNEYRYFNAAMSGDDTGNPESVEQDYSRMEAYNAGEWCMVGVQASVVLRIPHGKGFITQKIQSPGLWGIESDSGEDYLDEVFRDECSVLESMLTEMGKIEIVD